MATEEKYAKDGEIYREVFEDKESNPSKVITIAGRRVEVYIETILKKLQKYDQIELCCLDKYLDKAIVIIQMWEAIGLRPVKGKIEFTKAEEDIINRESGKMYCKPVNRISLTKIPELYRFTEP